MATDPPPATLPPGALPAVLDPGEPPAAGPGADGDLAALVAAQRAEIGRLGRELAQARAERDRIAAVADPSQFEQLLCRLAFAEQEKETRTRAELNAQLIASRADQRELKKRLDRAVDALQKTHNALAAHERMADREVGSSQRIIADQHLAALAQRDQRIAQLEQANAEIEQHADWLTQLLSKTSAEVTRANTDIEALKFSLEIAECELESTRNKPPATLPPRSLRPPEVDPIEQDRGQVTRVTAAMLALLARRFARVLSASIDLRELLSSCVQKGLISREDHRGDWDFLLDLAEKYQQDLEWQPASTAPPPLVRAVEPDFAPDEEPTLRWAPDSDSGVWSVGEPRGAFVTPGS